MKLKYLHKATQGALLSTLMAVTTGCATPGVDRNTQNTIIKEFYATIVAEKPVKLSSEVRTGIVAGAGIGLADELDGNSEDMFAGALAGALVFGLFSAILEGDNQAYQYSLSSVKEGDFTLIQKEQLNKDTNCVKVKAADKVTMVAVSEDLCSLQGDSLLSQS